AISPDMDASTDWEHPEPGQFHTHLLRVLPRDAAPRWVDMRNGKYSPMEALSSSLWGASVFVVDGASGSLDVMPRGAPIDAGQLTRVEVQLAKGGKAKAHIAFEIRAAELYDQKEQVKNAPKEQIKNGLAGFANQLFTGAKLKS